ncbi:MAG: MerR family transcriptional regulator [Candidatus Aminicenantes bacterium]|nr:MerR family transcriptional regulator [Candidatus Aminicenantes bacterium]
MSEGRPKEWTLRELAAETGATERTIRFYISRGILPPPLRAGRGAAYGEEHRARIEDIRRLQAQGLTLAEVAHALARGESAAPLVMKGGERADGVRRMVWFDMEGGVDRASISVEREPGPARSPERAIAEPEIWRSYALAPDVVVMFKAGASPWRAKRLVAALRRFAAEIEEGTKKEDTSE